jgi:hypothetical protein
MKIIRNIIDFCWARGILLIVDQSSNQIFCEPNVHVSCFDRLWTAGSHLFERIVR